MKLTEQELIKLINQGKMIQLSFGPGYVKLIETERNQWAVDFVEKMRSSN